MTSHLQDPLPIDEPERNAMWTEPEGEYGVDPIYDLKVMIARHLKRFDGRPNSEMVLAFCSAVYRMTVFDAHLPNTAWMIGQIVYQRHISVEALKTIAVQDLSDRRRQGRCRSQASAIEGLAETFVNTIVKYV